MNEDNENVDKTGVQITQWPERGRLVRIPGRQASRLSV